MGQRIASQTGPGYAPGNIDGPGVSEHGPDVDAPRKIALSCFIDRRCQAQRYSRRRRWNFYPSFMKARRMTNKAETLRRETDLPHLPSSRGRRTLDGWLERW